MFQGYTNLFRVLLTNKHLVSGHGFDDPQPVECANRKVYDKNRPLVRFDKGKLAIKIPCGSLTFK